MINYNTLKYSIKVCPDLQAHFPDDSSKRGNFFPGKLGRLPQIRKPACAIGTARFRLRGDWPEKIYSSPSTSSSHSVATASLGILQSPRGLRATEPTLGPSGRQERLNCWEKNLR